MVSRGQKCTLSDSVTFADIHNLFLSENNDPSAVRQFAWIPDEILQMTLASAEIRFVPLYCLVICILTSFQGVRRTGLI